MSDENTARARARAEATIGLADLFTIGIGPSSSHTVGPMRGALGFARRLRRAIDGGEISAVHGVRVHLFGSLGATGVGHGTVSAVVLGLAGHEPQTIDPDHVPVFMRDLTVSGTLHLPGGPSVPFTTDEHVLLHPDTVLPGHPNGMQFEALGADGDVLLEHRAYSVGGGFVVDEDELEKSLSQSSDVPHVPLPFPYATADQLVATCNEHGLTVGELQRQNELATRSEAEIRENLMVIWNAMRECVDRGCRSEGELPGGLGVQRRAAALHRSLASRPVDPLTALDWVNLYALAVNEENAAGGRVVTAPTNGAAGIVPAVLHYYVQFVPGADDEGVPWVNRVVERLTAADLLAGGVAAPSPSSTSSTTPSSAPPPSSASSSSAAPRTTSPGPTAATSPGTSSSTSCTTARCRWRATLWAALRSRRCW